MELHKFTILSATQGTQEIESVNILLNLDHIVSIKPIRLTTTDMNIMEGFWIRLSNGKKYKAISIPDTIKDIFDEELPPPSFLDSNYNESQIQ